MDSRRGQIERLIDEGKGFTFETFCTQHYRSDGDTVSGSDTPEWMTWKTRVSNAVRTLNDNSAAANRLASEARGIVTDGNTDEYFVQQHNLFMMALQNTLDALEDDRYGELAQPVSTAKSTKLSNKVFIVHGHDGLLKTELESFLKTHGFEPIVLHRQADQGKTLIEKFEHFADVGFAFILLTPDDVAYSVAEEKVPDAKRKTEYRARQNVILEFGFFVGKLGRGRTCCLYKGDVALPSDMSGLAYKKVEGSLEDKAYAILKELQAAGYTVKF